MVDLDFVIVGLANCWIRDKTDNSLSPVLLIEPVPSAAFLLLLQDIPSSFSLLMALEPKPLLEGQRPREFPQEARWADDFQERLLAAARTFQHMPEARIHLNIGQSMTLNNKLAHKRVINLVRNVNDDDNIKQHPNTHQVL